MSFSTGSASPHTSEIQATPSEMNDPHSLLTAKNVANTVSKTHKKMQVRSGHQSVQAQEASPMTSAWTPEQGGQAWEKEEVPGQTVFLKIQVNREMQ